MSGTLYVVATPIGNLEDVTLRALRVLREVDLIAAEDTRRTAKLLTHHGIARPAVSFHAHSGPARIRQLISRLERGESVAIVSDAGTPGISDPGVELVRTCLERGVPVEPVPGASALLAAVIASGFETVPLTFVGFPPRKSTDRKAWLAGVAAVRHTVVMFEAPHRMRVLLNELAQYLGERPLCIARELTKVHQEFLQGAARELANRPINARGEFTIVIAPSPQRLDSQLDIPADEVLAMEFCHMTATCGFGRRAAVTALARKYRRSSREVYASIEAAKTRVS